MGEKKVFGMLHIMLEESGRGEDGAKDEWCISDEGHQVPAASLHVIRMSQCDP